jgi:AhpD family alkylhydroperoxidase
MIPPNSVPRVSRKGPTDVPFAPRRASIIRYVQALSSQRPPLLDYHDRLLRDPSPLTVCDRELIAAYVSGLNACDFCHGAHIIAARVHGVAETLFEALLANVDTAPVDDKLKPLLRYVHKLTISPAKIAPSDAQEVFEVGWDEQTFLTRSASARCST